MNFAGVLYSSSNTGRMAPPGYPNMYSTLCGPISISCKMRAPVFPLYLGFDSVADGADVGALACSVDIAVNLKAKPGGIKAAALQPVRNLEMYRCRGAASTDSCKYRPGT